MQSLHIKTKILFVKQLKNGCESSIVFWNKLTTSFFQCSVEAFCKQTLIKIKLGQFNLRQFTPTSQRSRRWTFCEKFARILQFDRHCAWSCEISHRQDSKRFLLFPSENCERKLNKSLILVPLASNLSTIKNGYLVRLSKVSCRIIVLWKRRLSCKNLARRRWSCSNILKVLQDNHLKQDLAKKTVIENNNVRSCTIEAINLLTKSKKQKSSISMADTIASGNAFLQELRHFLDQVKNNHVFFYNFSGACLY